MNIFSYQGRLNRAPYIFLTIGCWLLAIFNYFAFYYFFLLFWKDLYFSYWNLLLLAVFLIYVLFLILLSIFNYSQTVRRLHDLNGSGWLWILKPTLLIPGLNYVTVFAVILLDICLCLFEGSVGPNHYGEDPKGRKGKVSEKQLSED
ncbi:DUF805 domain-containing protein [Methanolapillus africanus]